MRSIYCKVKSRGLAGGLDAIRVGPLEEIQGANWKPALAAAMRKHTYCGTVVRTYIEFLDHVLFSVQGAPEVCCRCRRCHWVETPSGRFAPAVAGGGEDAAATE